MRVKSIMSRRTENGNSHNVTERIEGVVGAIERVVDILHHNATTGPRDQPGLTHFMRHNPSKFDGSVTPDEAEYWIREIEKVFEAISCPEDKKVIFAAFLLTGEAEYCWSGVKRLMETNGEVPTWDSFKLQFFKLQFLEKYFPRSAKFAKEIEFLSLRQRLMSVHEYVVKFDQLSRYYSQPLPEEWKCQKFEEGLRHELKKAVVPLNIRHFLTMVETAKRVERLETDPERIIRPHRGSSSGTKFQKKPYNRPHRPQQGPMKCFNCGGAHFKRDCPQLRGTKPFVRRCFICNESGHYTNMCPNRMTNSGPKPQVLTGAKPQATGRVFAMTGEEATQSGESELLRKDKEYVGCKWEELGVLKYECKG
ncbi:uncharacterized protein LOC108339408 [Vigna angularis]|uniref:uncharacterized protein LOC108339408 n=1 Tax=Phaseolus angularis TaxID=3914 RepID=UPI000809A047|nr:uncharacterized protein LOC108339408 [Vigna angularis]